MEEGLRLSFATDEQNIPPYHEPNNRSCTDNIEVTVKKIKSWEERGFIVKVPERPFICSPLSVAEKLDYLSGEKKLRLCIDASRHLNKYLSHKKIKLENIDVSEKMMEQGDWMTAHQYILFKNAGALGCGRSSSMWKKMETLLCKRTIFAV